MDWEFSNDRPIYAQIVEQFEQAVVTGEYPPGGKLPGVRELAGMAGVNPNTMQRALTELESGGLLHTQRTSGRFVTSDTQKIKQLREQLAAKLSAGFVQNMRALGCTAEEIDSFVQTAREEV